MQTATIKIMKSHMMQLATALVLLVGMVGAMPAGVGYAAGGPIYVDANATGANNGSSWSNAFSTLQAALSSAASGDQIWVAAGTYHPTTGTDQTATFTLRNGVSIYGGFTGTETLLAERNPRVNMTILSGNIGSPGNPNDNSYHVVTASGTDSSAVLDGFMITAGNALGAATKPWGGGMINESGSPTLSQLVFRGNTAFYGGGLFNFLNSSPILTDVAFVANSAERAGGMYNNSNSNATLVNVTFSNNSASSFGGGMTISESDLTLTNVTFNGNTANFGGAISNIYQSTVVMKNVTMVGNHAGSSGGGIYNLDITELTIVNSILYDNSPDQIYNAVNPAAITYSIVQGGYAGTGNLAANTDPLLGPLQNNGGFTRTMALKGLSPAIDAGNIGSDCAPTDQRGIVRPQGMGCDIGAYEKDATLNVFSIELIDEALTSLTSVGFLVTFSDNVMGVDLADFVLTTTGLTGASVTSVTGSDDVYTVTVNTGSGNGTLRLDLVDDDSIKNEVGVFLGGLGQGNGSFNSGEMYMVSKQAAVDVQINGVSKFPALYSIAARSPKLITYSGFNGGPVQVKNTFDLPIVTSLGLRYKNAAGKFTFSELMGVPTSQLSNDYWLPYYKMNTTDTDSQLRFTNTSATESTTVSVYLGNNPTPLYTKLLPASSADRVFFPNTVGGPVRIVGSNPNVKILAGMRVIYGGNMSFDELMAYPASGISSQEYWFPFYNHNNVNLFSELRIANTSSTQSAEVQIYIGGALKHTGTIPPLTPFLKTFPGLMGGPVRVVSTGATPAPIVTSLGLRYKNAQGKFTFSELMGVPTSQLSNDYWLPYYKMNTTDTDTQLRFTNTSAVASTTVSVYLGNNPTPVYTKLLPASSADRVFFANTTGGPVRIVGSNPNVKILAGMRVIYGGNMSFDELMAYPTEGLSSEYWFPFYNHNNVNLFSELRVAVP
jgi:hypothetical protein